MGNKLSYPEVDLSGKVAIVTGGNTGIGYETAKGLARLGAHTFIACRSKERAEDAIVRMKAELSPDSSKQEEGKDEKKEGKEDEGGGEGQETVGEGAETAPEQGREVDEESKEGEEGQQESKGTEQKEVKVEYLPLDLSSFQSTIECVRVFKEKDLPLHILINNAALAWTPFGLTADGYETQFQVNVVSPMLLTLELLPLLLDTAATTGDGRIVIVSTKGNQALPFDAEKLVITDEADYNRFRSYPNTKLYDILLSFALQRRLKDSGITVSVPEPGYVKTNITQGFQDQIFLSLLNKIGHAALARSPREGAVTSLNCAVNPEFNTQECHFYSDGKVAAAPARALIENDQELLWQKVMEILKDHLSRDNFEKYGEAYVKQKTPPTTDVPSAEGKPDAEAPPTEQTPAEASEQTSD